MPFEVTDLHSHSTASDGALTPAALVARAHEFGVTDLALTDHDTLSGLDEARHAADQHGIRLVNGIELSVLAESREIHVLGLWVNPHDERLVSLVDAQQQARIDRAKLIGKRLDRAAGMANSYEKACVLAESPAPGRPLFARMLMENNKVRDMRHAFNRYLKQGQSAYVATPWCELSVAVDAIHHAGGCAVLAHPHAYSLTRKRLRQLLGEFKLAKGDAMEVMVPGLTMQQQNLLNECWQHFELKVSGGSDFHSPEQRWLSLGRLPPVPTGATPVWQDYR